MDDKLNGYKWIVLAEEEFDRVSSFHPSIPERFKREDKLQVLKKNLYGQFSSLQEGTGQEIWVEGHSFLIMKKNSLLLVGIGDTTKISRDDQDLQVNVESFAFQSKKMNEVMDLVRKVSFVDSTVLLLGKTGVGKSHIAKKIHEYSQRSGKPFATINCSAIPETLIEAELFGYTAGSFTGGKKEGKSGIFQSATGGSVFLDEIGEVPFHLQAKLLEVIQDNQIRPIGSSQSFPVDVRIIAATNQNLEEMVANKLFREDLFYRLNVVPIHIPPLAERKEELSYLSHQFLNTFNKKYHKRKRLSQEVMNVFQQYDWPGNVRELENMIERLLITVEEDDILIQHLPDYLLSMDNGGTGNTVSRRSFPPLKEAKRQLENEIITNAYRLYKNTYKVAEILEVNQSTIAKKVKQLRERGEL